VSSVRCFVLCSYKGRLFQGDDLSRATVWLIEEAARAVHQRDTEPSTSAVDDATSADLPVTKRMRPSSPSTGTPLNVLDELLGTSAAECEASVDDQVRTYLAQPTISRNLSPCDWWRDNHTMFPAVAAVARCYLSAPSTSVPSERLFSAAGIVYTDRRNRLLPERAEMLLFIKHNLRYASSI